MVKVTIDSRTFTPTDILVSHGAYVDIETEKNDNYLEYTFEENGKKYLVREKQILKDDGSFEVQENPETEWYVQE